MTETYKSSVLYLHIQIGDELNVITLKWYIWMVYM